MGLQLLLKVVGAILAAAIEMENAAVTALRALPAAGWLAQVYGHLQRPYRQILLHPVVYRPTDDAPAEQINDDCQIKPAFDGPDVTDSGRVRQCGVKSGSGSV